MALVRKRRSSSANAATAHPMSAMSSPMRPSGIWRRILAQRSGSVSRNAAADGLIAAGHTTFARGCRRAPTHWQRHRVSPRTASFAITYGAKLRSPVMDVDEPKFTMLPPLRLQVRMARLHGVEGPKRPLRNTSSKSLS